MIAAEKWYEYQTSYRKYGLDMKPTTKESVAALPKEAKRMIDAKDKGRLMALTVFVGLICICLIVMAAYSAQVKYNINGVLAQSDKLQGEIDNLSVQINSASNITSIENKAETRLGMVYPTSDQITYIETGKETITGFAQTLKQIAYNQ
jgi:cell division protein FtsL